MAHTMTFDLDQGLQGYLPVTLPVLWIIFICDTYTTHEGMQIFAVRAGDILVDHQSTISSWLRCVA